MEILQHTLADEYIKSLTTFELKIWNILNSLLKDVIEDRLSEESSIEKGLGIDVFLKLRGSDFILYLSISKDRFYINSKYFDIYVYPETELDKIEFLLKQVLLGKYSIILGYSNNDTLVYKELIFESEQLEEFNEKQKVGFFPKTPKSKKREEGVQLIRS